MTPELKAEAIGRNALISPTDIWAGETTDYPRNETVARLFELAASKYADRTAIVCGDSAMTFGELNRKANRLAHCLRTHGVGPETMVGLCVGRSPEMVSPLVARPTAGEAYVAYDAHYPRERLEVMIADTMTPIMVTQKSLLNVMAHSGPVKTILVDEELQRPEENPVPVGGPT